MITKYDKFILESIKNEILLEGAICASSNFLFRLRKIADNNVNPTIAKYAVQIIEFIESEDWIDEDDIKQNYFDVTDKEDTLSFIQQKKHKILFNSVFVFANYFRHIQFFSVVFVL